MVSASSETARSPIGGIEFGPAPSPQVRADAVRAAVFQAEVSRCESVNILNILDYPLIINTLDSGDENHNLLHCLDEGVDDEGLFKVVSNGVFSQ